MILLFGLLTTTLIPVYFLVLNKKKEMTVPLKISVILCICSTILQLGLWLCLWDGANSLLFIVPYLIIQSYTDAKIQQVYRFPSYIFGAIGVILCFVFHVNVSGIVWFGIIGIAIFSIGLGVFKLFGLGDSISMIVIIPFLLVHYQNNCVWIYISILLIGCIAFIFGHIKKRKGAFLPYLSIGFLITVAALSVLGGV